MTISRALALIRRISKIVIIPFTLYIYAEKLVRFIFADKQRDGRERPHDTRSTVDGDVGAVVERFTNIITGVEIITVYAAIHISELVRRVVDRQLLTLGLSLHLELYPAQRSSTAWRAVSAAQDPPDVLIGFQVGQRTLQHLFKCLLDVSSGFLLVG